MTGMAVLVTGGPNYDWEDGTWCLSVRRRMEPHGGQPCQIAGSESACELKLDANGCRGVTGISTFIINISSIRVLAGVRDLGSADGTLVLF